MNFLKQGGFMMWTILFTSIVGLSIIIERYFYFRKAIKSQKQFLKDLKTLSVTKEKTHLKKFLKKLSDEKQYSFYLVIHTIVSNINKDNLTLEKLTLVAIQKEVSKLEKGLTALNTIASISPLMGLLGTVLGMIESFTYISFNQDQALGEDIANGISKALLTTAFGLFVAIPCIIFYNYFSKKLDTIINDIETTTLNIINQLKKS